MKNRNDTKKITINRVSHGVEKGKLADGSGSKLEMISICQDEAQQVTVNRVCSGCLG